MNEFQAALDRLRAQRAERERIAALSAFEEECSRRAGEIAANLLADRTTFATVDGETTFTNTEPDAANLADDILN